MKKKGLEKNAIFFVEYSNFVFCNSNFSPYSNFSFKSARKLAAKTKVWLPYIEYIAMRTV